MWLGALFERIVGALFIFSATVKVIDLPTFELQIRYYNVLTEPGSIAAAALAVVVIESLLGVALLAGLRLRGITLGATAALLLGFTGLVVYGWAFQGLEECGCFGGFIEMTPGVTITKNVIMLLMLGLTWKLSSAGGADASAHGHAALRAALGVCGAVVVFSAAAYGGAGASGGEQPFADLTYHDGLDDVSLAEGEHLAVFYGATCDHCMATVPALNELAVTENAPPIVAFMLGEPGEIEEFELITQPLFPLAAMDIVEFSRFVGRAPPRFVLVRDGEAIAHWDDAAPTLEAIEELMGS